jgi:hypothetical protein
LTCSPSRKNFNFVLITSQLYAKRAPYKQFVFDFTWERQININDALQGEQETQENHKKCLQYLHKLSLVIVERHYCQQVDPNVAMLSSLCIARYKVIENLYFPESKIILIKLPLSQFPVLQTCAEMCF